MMHVADSSTTSKPVHHQQRVRSFPHVEGNYATVVYIPGGASGCTIRAVLTGQSLPVLHHAFVLHTHIHEFYK